MLIVNGRIGADSKVSHTTCKNVSTVDYYIASLSLFEIIVNMKVDLFDSCLSDVHNPIFIELNRTNCIIKDPGSPKSAPKIVAKGAHNSDPSYKTNWDQSKEGIFKEAFDLSAIEKLCNQIQIVNENVNKDVINKIASSLCNVYKEAGCKAGVMFARKAGRIERGDANKKKNIDKPWFNNDCRKERKLFFADKNALYKQYSATNREKFSAQSKKYKKTLYEALRLYNSDLHSKLRRLKSNSPKDYWKILNSASTANAPKGLIDIETLETHFRSINTCNNEKLSADNYVNCTE